MEHEFRFTAPHHALSFLETAAKTTALSHDSLALLQVCNFCTHTSGRAYSGSRPTNHRAHSRWPFMHANRKKAARVAAHSRKVFSRCDHFPNCAILRNHNSSGGSIDCEDPKNCAVAYEHRFDWRNFLPFSDGRNPGTTQPRPPRMLAQYLHGAVAPRVHWTRHTPVRSRRRMQLRALHKELCFSWPARGNGRSRGHQARIDVALIVTAQANALERHSIACVHGPAALCSVGLEHKMFVFFLKMEVRQKQASWTTSYHRECGEKD